MRQSPEASAELHAALGDDAALYKPMTRTLLGRERLRLQITEDPGFALWLETTVEGQGILA
ncbi:hypothetical protein AB0K02_23465 [Streptomyces sp. NPDC049597]|uniref:hypothetical protein n=1 Tax=Streptomyces sp. NPDC049597 TaxID=3155276 RepID=UPI00343FCC42